MKKILISLSFLLLASCAYANELIPIKHVDMTSKDRTDLRKEGVEYPLGFFTDLRYTIGFYDRINKYRFSVSSRRKEQSHLRWNAGRYNRYKQLLSSRKSVKSRLYPIRRYEDL